MYNAWPRYRSYFAAIAIRLAVGLLFSPAVFAVEPHRISEVDGENTPLVSVEGHDEIKNRQKELFEEHEIAEVPRGNDEKIDAASEKDIAVEYKEDENGNLTEVEIKSSSLKVNVEIPAPDKVVSKAKAGGSTNKIAADEIYADNRAHDSFTDSEEDASDITVAVNGKDLQQLLNIYCDNTQNTRIIIKKNVNRLFETQKSAADRFYMRTAPYYDKLAFLLKRAYWLWQKWGIDSSLYFGNGDGVLDESEARKMVEEAVTYLYENIPDDKEALGERNEILKLEKSLRTQYVDPALKLYKDELEKASRSFLKAIEEIIKLLNNPFINKIDGQIEVIITLPKKPVK